MTKTWILVADAHRARCFERDGADTALNELADFIYPHASLGGQAADTGVSAQAGKGHGRTGHAGTQFEPKTDLEAKERGSFARQLADFLNKGVLAQRCGTLALIAPAPMLGELKPCLSPTAQKLLSRSVALDLTHYQGPDLLRRVDQALSPPG